MTASTDLPTLLWKPSAERIARSNITAFIAQVNARWQAGATDHASLYEWSIREPERFWESVWDYAGIVGEKGAAPFLVDGARMPGAKWFPNARLNFAENLLRRRDDQVAMVFWGENKVKRQLSFRELHEQVSRLAQALRAVGVGPGDRVAGFMPNMPETITAMLAATSIGAIWSSCSPDFGVQGVLDRFGQIEPKVLFCVDGYHYGGKTHDSLERVCEIASRLPTLERVVVVPYVSDAPEAPVAKATTLGDFIAPHAAGVIVFERLPFDHPLYILYSSGTTGVPKCIVHGAGGTLLQHVKEHQLHTDLKRDDRLFYFTTCGWMMWNWLASGLASEATLLLFDGSPFHPDPSVLFDFAEKERMNVFGTSAKYIDGIAKVGLEPRTTHRLDSLRTMTSTGSPLSPESFEYVYRSIKKDLLLSSISGGTDIVSCFVLGSPLLPVWKGEIQARGFGLKVEVFDETGCSVVGKKGELVCTAPFPSMPVRFWNDPDGRKYHEAYFAKFPGVWCHGDYMELTPRGTSIIYGRSDAVLNPGGVRIGTAEIYRQVEQLPEVVESLVIGQDWQGDVRVVLFVKLREGSTLDDELIKRIKLQIRTNTTPRHVPARICQVADIPRTKSGKIVELAVRNVVHGLPVKNQEALANPEALALFRNRPELQT